MKNGKPYFFKNQNSSKKTGALNTYLIKAFAKEIKLHKTDPKILRKSLKTFLSRTKEEAVKTKETKITRPTAK